MKIVPSTLIFASLALSACGDLTTPNAQKNETSAEARQANAKRLKRACGSAETYERLKALAFDEAVKVRKAESPLLDQLASASLVRMESPVAKSRDETLNVTVCSGHFVLELPPGARDAFDGDQRLEADVEYAAQEAADGSGLVYRMQGAEPIIYRLAALDLQAAGRPRPTATQIAAAPAPPANPAAPAAPALPPAPRMAPAPVAPVAPPEPVIEEAPARPPSRPSFNCNRARSRVERMICSSDDLARRDRAMSSAFYAALARADGRTRAALRNSRDRFLGFRERCRDEACVAQAYSDRVDEIRDIERGR